MSPKQWLALLCFFVSYLFFGASVFYHIETDLEAERRAANKLERLQLHELIIASVPDNETLVAEIYSKVNELCDTDVHIHAPPKPYEWTFYHSFFFSFIVCSTIGYGNISPHSVFGRMFLILYALIGIPVNGFLFAGLGDFFGKTFIGVYNRYRIYKMATTKNYMPMRFTLIGRILLYLLPGIIFFIFIPACIFSYFEDWPYTTSIYYSFVTLTTIGFGDFVATFNSDEKDFGPVYYFYEIFIIFWFIFGLGYLVMILGFIAKGMRSKRITRLEHQLATNIKSTQQRIWQGVTKDVGYLRRILNELYMMKFKPVYTDEDPDYAQTIHRSNSCPDDLHLYRIADDDEDTVPHPRRRRAVSVPHWDETTSAVPSISMLRIQSDTDLTRIDRERTFDRAASESFRHEHILAKVVSALGAIRPTHDDGLDAHSVLDLGTMEAGGGVHGFSDADILASEYVASGWTLNQSMDGGYGSVPKHRRARAASVFSVPTMVDPSGGSPGTSAYEWTWSGQNAAQVQEFLRGKTKPRKHSLFRNVFVKDHSPGDLHGSVSSERAARSRTASVSIQIPPSSSLPDVQTVSTSTGSVFVPQPQPPTAAAINTSLFTKLNPFRRRILSEHGHRHSLTGLDTLSPAQYLERSARGRPSQPFGPKQYLQATARGRKSAFSVMTTAEPAHDDVLENTTIADLIRALEVVHTTVERENYGPEVAGTGSSPDSPRRKMGLASLSPPKMSPVAALRNAGRRGSLRPQPTYTTVFNSKLLAPGLQRTGPTGSGTSRRPSQHFTMDSTSINMDNAGGMDQHQQPPPPYDMRGSLKNRRFSVRPTNLSMAPGQVFQIPSVQVQSAVQRRMSLKPSPLARGGTGQSSARYARDTTFASAARGVESPRMARHQFQPGAGAPTGAGAGPGPAGSGGGRTVMWRPKLVQSVRTRHGSLSELHEERNERKRSDSK